MGHMIMSEKERQRKAYMEMVKQHQLTLVKACEHLEMSYRQGLRLYKKYTLNGDAGLIHKSRGKASNRQHPKRTEIIEQYKKRYWDFGATFASEKLAEDDKLFVDHETLRRWLMKEGLLQKQRKRKAHKQRREPKAQFGELIQIDGSFHDWFEDGKENCLINFVDDATSKTMSRLEEGETTAGLFRVMWQWIETNGIPMAIYVDLKNVYVPHKKEGFTHFQNACRKLGIRIIKAYSPQAKGRVERKHAVYQDRFIKELRLAEIKTLDKANEFLANTFIEKLNTQFAKPARVSESAHRPFEGDLKQILCWEYVRQVQNDWTVQFEKQFYQIEKMNKKNPRAKQNIVVRKHLDGSISLWFEEQVLAFHVIEARLKKEIAHSKQGYDSAAISKIARANKHKTPWSQFNPNWLKNKEKPETEMRA